MDDDERFMTTAWHVGYFGRVNKMPTLSEVLSPYRRKLLPDGRPAPVAASNGRDPNMSKNLMNALLQFPAGKVPGERIKPSAPETPSP
jgi:hypothetical protein